jgi:hypothetical protein
LERGKINDKNKVKTLNITMLCGVVALCLTTQARAEFYDITFDDGSGNIGSGKVDVQSAGNNLFYAASGYLEIQAGGASGIWDLYSAGGTTPFPGYLYSPSGGYIYNNAVYPTGQNPQYPNVNSLLDLYGLLFTQGNANELNLWGNADGTYTLGGNIGGFQNFLVNIGFGGTASTPIITQAPEPNTTTLATLSGVLVALGVFRNRR